MELTCVLVLLVQISYVITSPYGYGPRVGASAKAEASAAAGALPVDIPQGAGYSGGFSKSYSSSSATSSASSSASSSSFSYSGSGSGESPHGGEIGCGSGDCKFGVKGSTGSQGAFSGNNAASLPGQGAVGTGGSYNDDVNGGSHSEPKISDCGSGNCRPTGAKDPGSHGSTGTSNAYSGANALASAGAGLQYGSTYSKDNKNKPGCENSDCGSPTGSDSKCSSGQCGPNGNSDASVKCSLGNCGTSPQPSANYETESKCTSGQCGPNTQPGSLSNGYNSNDIQVPTGTTGASNVKTNYGSYATNSNTGCKHGNCGPQPASNPSYTPEYPPCSSPDCNNYGQGPSSTSGNQIYNKPFTHLTTPKEDAECTSPNCQTTHNKPPSVTSFSAPNYDTSGQNSFTNPPSTSCIDGNCNYGNTKAPYSSTSVKNSLNSQQPSQIPNSPSNCASGNCNLYPSTQGPVSYGGYSSNQPPNTHGSAAPHSPLPPSAPNCIPGSLNCNAGALALPPVSSCLPGSPTCNDNFGPAPKPGSLFPLPPVSSCSGPADGPCNNAFVAKPKPGPGTPFPSEPSCAPGSTNCNAGPSTGYYDSNPKPGPLSPIPPHHNSRPYGSSPSHSFQPTGIAAFPPGPIGGSYSVTGSLTSSPHAPSVGYQPGLTGSGIYTSTPTSSSYNSPSSGLPTSQNGIATPSYNTPSEGCNTPNCAGSGIGHVDATAGANTQSKPIGASPSSDELPHYNGGFGGPSGILKPNEFKAPSSPYTPSTPITSNPTSCATGNCVQHSPTSPSYGTNSGSLTTAGAGANTGFGGPAGVLKPNEFAVPSSTYNKPAISGTSENKPACSTGSCGQSDTSPAYSHSGSGAQATAGASASADAVAYTGGFGGPPGFLKPFDSGKVDPTAGKSQGGQYGPHQGSYSNNGVRSHQGSYTNNGVGSQSNAGIQASSLAKANSVAGAASGTNGAGSYNNGAYGQKEGCGGGCSAPSSGSYGSAPSGSYGGNRGRANFGGEGGLDGLHVAGASAKSQAGAVGGSGGYGGSYASSSATAHAASGAAIKGSYGK